MRPNTTQLKTDTACGHHKKTVRDQAASPSVLLVDDEPAIRFTFQLALEKCGFKVATESTGRAAIKRFKTQTFDAIILDPQISDMDGQELLSEMKSLGIAIPTLVTSTSSSRALPLKKCCLQHGIPVNFVLKPLEPDTLRNALKALLKDRAAVSSCR